MRVVFFGLGSVGCCVLDCLLHVRPAWARGIQELVLIDKTSLHHLAIGGPWRLPVHRVQVKVTKKNVSALSEDLCIGPGDIVIDLMSGTGTLDMIRQVSLKRGARYISTSLDQWDYLIGPLSTAVQKTILFRKKHRLTKGTPTVLLTHGMNPGLVNHFCLVGLDAFSPKEKRSIDKIHITEVDDQGPPAALIKTPDVFSKLVMKNVKSFGEKRSKEQRVVWTTWAPQNFMYEMNSWPSYGLGRRVIFLRKPAIQQWLSSQILDPMSWALQRYQGMTVDHEEAFTLQHFLSRHVGHAKTEYRFVYMPCPLSIRTLFNKGQVHEMLTKGILDDKMAQDLQTAYQVSTKSSFRKNGGRPGRLLSGPLKGHDTVGTLIDSPSKSVWIGNVCPGDFLPVKSMAGLGHNATCYQVSAGVLAGLWYLIQHPEDGMVFPEEVSPVDRLEMMRVAETFMGPVVSRVVSKSH